MKKYLALVLSLVMVLALALPAQAAVTEKGVLPIVDEPITLTVAFPVNAKVEDMATNELTLWYEEQTGIQLEFVELSTEDTATQVNMLMNSGDLPDMILGYRFPYDVLCGYADAGLIVPLDEQFEKYGYYVYSELLPAAGDNALSYVTYDGKKWAVPSGGALITDMYGGYYNRIQTQFLEALGMEMPRTIDELYNFLVGVRDNDVNGNGDPNDEIPLSFTMDQFSGTRGEFSLRNSFGIYGYKTNYQLQVTDGKVWLADTSENWKAYVTYMHRLYEEGLLDPDCFIQTNDEYIAKIRNNQIGYFASWSTLDSVMKTDDKRVYLDYTFVTGFESELAPEVIYPLWNPVTEVAVDVVSASASDEAIAKICEIMNYFYTEEGMIDNWIGVDGLDCTIVEGAYGLKSADGTGYFEESGLTYAQWRERDVTMPNTFQLVQYSPGQTMVDNATIDELKVFLDEAAASDDFNDHVLLIDAFKDYYTRQVKTCADYPQVTYTTAEQDERAVLLTDITNYIQTMKAQFIIGETDIETGWDTYLETLNSMGLQRLLEIEQQVYDRYAKNL